MSGLKDDEIQWRIRNYRLLDNEFMLQVFSGRPDLVEHMLSVILEDNKLHVISVTADSYLGNLRGHTARLDIRAEDEDKKQYDIEVQRYDTPAIKKRARYYSSLVDVNALKKGEEYDCLPDSFVIFITEQDHFSAGKPVYNIERTNIQVGVPFRDGEHILFVNASYVGDDPIGSLMNDFRVSDPSEMNSDQLAEVVRYFKEDEKGVQIMTGTIKELFDEGMEEGIQQGIEQERTRTILSLLSKLSKEDLLSLGYTTTEIENAMRS